MTTRRKFIKNALIGGTALVVCPNILCNEDKTPNLSIGDRNPQSIIGEPGAIYRRMDDSGTLLYVHSGSLWQNADWSEICYSPGAN